MSITLCYIRVYFNFDYVSPYYETFIYKNVSAIFWANFKQAMTVTANYQKRSFMHVCGNHLGVEWNWSVNSKELPLAKFEVPWPLAVYFWAGLSRHLLFPLSDMFFPLSYLLHTLTSLRFLLNCTSSMRASKTPLSENYSSLTLSVYHHLTYLCNLLVYLFSLCADIRIEVPWKQDFWVVYCYNSSTQNTAWHVVGL